MKKSGRYTSESHTKTTIKTNIFTDLPNYRYTLYVVRVRISPDKIECRKRVGRKKISRREREEKTYDLVQQYPCKAGPTLVFAERDGTERSAVELFSGINNSSFILNITYATAQNNVTEI